LNKAAVGVLESIPGKREGLVIKGRRKGHRLTGHWKIWQRGIKAAKIEGLRIHDLRHSFASVGVASNMGLPIVGKLLGHSQASTTQRYSHLAADPVRAAAEIIGDQIAAALAGNGAKVVDVVREERNSEQREETGSLGR